MEKNKQSLKILFVQLIGFSFLLFRFVIYRTIFSVLASILLLFFQKLVCKYVTVTFQNKVFSLKKWFYLVTTPFTCGYYTSFEGLQESSISWVLAVCKCFDCLAATIQDMSDKKHWDFCILLVWCIFQSKSFTETEF